MKQAFRSMDKDKAGYITIDNITDEFIKNGYTDYSEKITELAASLDFDGDGKINYSDFLTATVNK